MRTRLLLFVPLALALSAGCGKKSSNDRCTGVICDGVSTCDPADGVCKCGGEGGLVCAPGQTCDPTARTCADPQISCATVTCTGNTSCDSTDGLCKCGGAGGPVCAAGEVCSAETRTCAANHDCSSVTCADGETCDPADGACKCNGAVCGEGEACVGADGGCAPSLCAGVHCIGGTSCDPADGACKCNGTVCGASQACECPLANADAGDTSCAASALICTTSSRCAGVSCTGGSTCDPADGQCKCGGPGGPICGSGQSCQVGSGACLGGDRCRNITCGSGSSCDPEDGRCKCGGLGGQICTDAEQCFGSPAGYACRIPCDPSQQNCPPSLACYFDETAGSATGYCATPGTKTDIGSPPPLCDTASDCAQGYHCSPEVGSSFPGSCHRYCDVSGGAGGCTGAQNCLHIGGGAPTDLGACQ